jgi:hypothetical protein
MGDIRLQREMYPSVEYLFQQLCYITECCKSAGRASSVEENDHVHARVRLNIMLSIAFSIWFSTFLSTFSALSGIGFAVGSDSTPSRNGRADSAQSKQSSLKENRLFAFWN